MPQTYMPTRGGDRGWNGSFVRLSELWIFSMAAGCGREENGGRNERGKSRRNTAKTIDYCRFCGLLARMRRCPETVTDGSTNETPVSRFGGARHRRNDRVLTRPGRRAPGHLQDAARRPARAGARPDQQVPVRQTEGPAGPLPQGSDP